MVPTSYLAIVTLFDDTSTVARAPVTYRVSELSGTLGVDTVLVRAPSDTVLLDLPPATYTVTVDGLPSTCGIARGTVQYIVVYPPPSTALARYFVLCKPALTLVTLTDGVPLDDAYTWRVEGPGVSRSGLIGANDTLRVEGVTGGTYTVELGHVAGHCVVTGDGGRRQSLHVDSTGGAAVMFRVACSEEAKRPRLVAFGASYHDGAAALFFRATDPDRDIERYVFDLTDCAGRSVLPSGSRLRRGLTIGRTAAADTVMVAAAFEIGLADSVFQGRCASLRVADEYGNTTPINELPLLFGSGGRPVATSFNAFYSGTSAVHTDVQGFDADGDLAGYFVAVELRDGILGGSSDGRPDIGVYNSAGYDALPLPELPLSAGRIAWGDVTAVIVYLVDTRGHFARIEDRNLFQ